MALVIIWQLPHGRMLLYPLTLCATYAHEMGHGLAAILVGGHFDKLVIHADGSGAATWQGNPGRFGAALVAAGGLLGPTVAGVSLLLLSNSDKAARRAMTALAVLMAASVVILVRNSFGMAFVLGLALALFAGARYLTGHGAAMVLRCIAIALCLSWFNDLDYMFSPGAIVGGVAHHSDTAAMAQALFLPYWFWGGVIACVSLSIAVVGVGFATSQKSMGKAGSAPNT